MPYMVTGRCSIDGENYCFNSDGSMHTGWYTEIHKWADDGSDCIDWLYFDPDGKLHKISDGYSKTYCRFLALFRADSVDRFCIFSPFNQVLQCRLLQHFI